jgi:CBS domain-containing membrane protein
MKKLKVRDLMTEKVHALSVNDSALAAYDLMDEKHIRHLPIVDDEEEVVGLLSERDLLRHALANTADLPVSEKRRFLKELKIEELMSSTPYTVEPDTDLGEAGRMLLEYKFSCLPVAEGGRLVGILTESDFVRHIADADEG